MILFDNKNECCGCGACESVCPMCAITMIEDEQGFYYPHVNSEKCIDCGKCKRVCAFQGKHNSESTIKGVFALQHNNKKVILSSSSGGAFTALSDIIINAGGVVFGAELDKQDFTVRHKSKDTSEGRDCLKESKYVQSITAGIFSEVSSELEKGRQVLFSGTPCQCAAVKKYFGGSPDNLILVEVLCHGTPSNKILKDHIAMWERKTGKKVTNYHYRSKIYGYEYTHLIEFEDGTCNKSIELKRLLKLYTLSMRPSCYNCPYASRHRSADITIGDLWEAGEVAQIYDHRGTSTVIVNTEKGQKLLDCLTTSCSIKPISLSLDGVGALNHCVKQNRTVRNFWDTYQKSGYEAALEKFAPKTLKSTVYQSLLRTLYYTKTDALFIRIKSKARIKKDI